MRGFWNSSYTERLLLSDVFGWSLGAAVAGSILMQGIYDFCHGK